MFSDFVMLFWEACLCDTCYGVPWRSYPLALGPVRNNNSQVSTKHFFVKLKRLVIVCLVFFFFFETWYCGKYQTCKDSQILFSHLSSMFPWASPTIHLNYKIKKNVCLNFRNRKSEAKVLLIFIDLRYVSWYISWQTCNVTQDFSMFSSFFLKTSDFFYKLKVFSYIFGVCFF